MARRTASNLASAKTAGADVANRSTADVVLRADGLNVGYNRIPVVVDLELEVRAGELVALLGSNGAGKTTTLMALAGVLQPSVGTVELLGAPTKAPLHVRTKRGLGLVTEERSVIFGLSVMDNLRLARGDISLALDLFPELKPLLRRRAGLLSGGEQQILALARTMSKSPKVLLADELSLGLAPLVVQRLLAALRDVASTGVGVLLVEQQVAHALGTSDRAYVMRRGKIVLSGPSKDLLARIDQIEATYFSAAAEV